MSLSEGQVAVGVVLASFVGTVALTRTITRVIRARQNSGGVFKISTLTACMCTTRCGDIAGAATGLFKRTYQPHQMAPVYFGELFGVGAALALDLICHVDFYMRDVHGKRGRASISALGRSRHLHRAAGWELIRQEASPTGFQFGDKVSGRNLRHSY